MQFIESIKILDGEIYLQDLHLQRINRTLQTHFLHYHAWRQLVEKIPDDAKIGLQKCKIVYDNMHAEIIFTPYKKQIIEKIACVEVAAMQYDFKYANRDAINKYKAKMEVGCEVIFTKNGLLTDASYANICLWSGQAWHTPAVPMLHGVMRTNLLTNKKIIEKEINVSDLKKYSRISFINALNNLNENVLDINT